MRMPLTRSVRAPGERGSPSGGPGGVSSRVGSAASMQVEGERMRRYWDSKARENAMYYIHSTLDYSRPDAASFWASGGENLDATLAPFGVSIGPEDRVVEIGCGIGRMTRAIATRSKHVIGVDVSTEMVERARESLADLDNVELMVGDGRDLGTLADSSADIVYSFIVFQHIPDPAITCSYIREIGRVLRPGGWTVFQVSEKDEIHRAETWSSDEGLRTRIAKVLGRHPRGCEEPEWLGSALSRERLLEALSEAGLTLDATFGSGSQFCMVHARRPSTAKPSGAEGAQSEHQRTRADASLQESREAD
jgi:ubiquinone/menaquinone biosynthesis C-methylase UbiE